MTRARVLLADLIRSVFAIPKFLELNIGLTSNVDTLMGIMTLQVSEWVIRH